MEVRKSLGLKGLLKKAIGCPCCDRTTPIPTPEASVSTVKGSWKSGKANTGASDRARASIVQELFVPESTIGSLLA